MQEYCLKIIRWLAYIIVFAPLLVTNSMLFPFITGKTFGFRIIVEIMAAAFVLLIWSQPNFRPRWRSPVFLVVTGWMLVLTISSLVGADFGASFWSSYERMTGLLTLLHLYVFFIILWCVFRTEREWQRLLGCSVAAGILISLFAVGQALGLPLVHSGEVRLPGTIGNPSFLAGYLIFNIFFALYLLLKNKGGWRYFYTFAFIFQTIILLYTLTRGAIIALFAGFLFFLFYIVFSGPGGKWRWRLLISALVILIAVSGFVYLIVQNKNQPWVQQQPLLSRIATISWQEGATRFKIWQLSWQGAQERFWFGWGPENFNLVYNKYFDPHLYRVEMWYDRAHNIVFDTLTTTGIIGFIVYLGIFIVILFGLWRKRKENLFLSAAASSLLVTYFLQNFFVFDMINTYLLFFLLLGWAAWGMEQKIETEQRTGRPQQQMAAAQQTAGLLLPSIVGVLLIFSFYHFNIKPILTSYYTIQALRETAATGGNRYSEQAMQYFQKAFQYKTFGDHEGGIQLGQYALAVWQNSVPQNEQAQKLLQLAIKQLEYTTQERPQDARYLSLLGLLYHAAGRYQPVYLQKSDEIFNRTVALVPNKQVILFQAAQTKMALQKYDEAFALLRRAAIGDPTMFEPWRNLGIAYLLTGQDEKAEKMFRRAATVGYQYRSLEHINLKAGLYNQLRKLDKVAATYEEGIKLFPQEATFYARLAGVYAQLGKREQAKKMAEKAAQLNPDMAKDAAIFLEQLK